MKKIILYILIVMQCILYADHHNITTIDGIQYKLTQSSTQKIIDCYDAFGNFIHTYHFDNKIQDDPALDDIVLSTITRYDSPNSIMPLSHAPHNSLAPLHHFITEQEQSKRNHRAKSFKNDITDQQILSQKFLSGNSTLDEIKIYYRQLEAEKERAAQAEQQRLADIAYRKNLVKEHEQTWNQLYKKQKNEYQQAQQNHTSAYELKRLQSLHKKQQHDLLVQQYQENPTYSKYIYLLCKKVKDTTSSLFGTQYPPLINQKSSIETSYNELDLIKKIHKHTLQYKSSLQLHHLHDQYQAMHDDTDDQSPEFTMIMNNRLQALEESLQQTTPLIKKNQIKDTTARALQVYNINPDIFVQTDGLAINHQLTDEIINLLDHLAEIASSNKTNADIQISSLICAQTAALAQEQNNIDTLAQAFHTTNCTHGLYHYIDGLSYEGLERCVQMLESLAYFNMQLGQYAVSAAKGIAHGIIATEITSAAVQAIGSIASTYAPALTASISSTAGTIIVPLAVTAGTICAAVAIGEIAQLGYFYTTGQMVSFHQECDRIYNFAAQFYDMNQTSYQHVENVSQTIATIIWPLKGQAIIHALQGLQTVHCTGYVAGQKIIQQSFVTSPDIIKQAHHILQHQSLEQFNGYYKKIIGEHYFDFFKKEQLALAGITETLSLQDITSFLPANTHVMLQQSIENKIITSGASSLAQQSIQQQIRQPFLDTEIGKYMHKMISKDYEQKIFNNIAKVYDNLIYYKTPQNLINQFLRCQEISTINIEQRILLDKLQEKFKHEDTIIQLKHIFHPKISIKFDKDYQSISEFFLEGFHHDPHGLLEKSGLFTYIDKIYGQEQFNAQECFMASLNYGDGIVCKNIKTFFPSSWSEEQVINSILYANKHRIQELETSTKNHKLFLCKGPNNLLIEVIVNMMNIIISAYPSSENFIRIY